MAAATTPAALDRSASPAKSLFLGNILEQNLFPFPGIREAERETLHRAWGGVCGDRFWHALHGGPLEDDPPARHRTLGHSHVLAPELRTPPQAGIVARRLLLKAASRLRRMNSKVGNLAFMDVSGRVARSLLDLCKEPDAMTHPDGMQIKVTRQELGRIVGCSREMVGRVLKTLEEQHLIAVSGKSIVVFNVYPEQG